MAEPGTRRISPLVIIVAVLLVGLIAYAALHRRSTAPAPGGDSNAPQDQPATAPTMPQQSSVPNRQASTSNVPWAKARDGRPNSANEEGGTQDTGNGVAGSADGAR